MILTKQLVKYLLSIILLNLTCCTPLVDDVADMILINGNIITVDSEFTIHEAIAVKNGRILDVGGNGEIMTLSGKHTNVVDLKGHTIIPGIIEGHLHPVMASQSELYEEIPDLHSVDELLNWIHNATQKKQEGEWIIHPKFFATRMHEMRGPTLEELDSVAPHNPVFLDGTYGGTVNSSAFFYSGINSPFDHPGILKDAESGLPNGLLQRSAFKLLKIDGEGVIDDSTKMEALKIMLHHYNRVGITSICSGLGTTETLNLFKAMEKSGDLTLRVFQNIQIPFSPYTTVDEMNVSLKELGYKTGDGNEWVKVGALKTLIDGGVLTGTAFLRDPWGDKSKDIYGITDPHYRGVLMISKEELIQIITVAAKSGWKFTAHVTGGGAVDTLLAAYQVVNRTIPIREKRFSIIHGNFFTAESIKIMADLGIYADMQPAWYYKDADLLNNVLGEERINSFHPYKSLFEADIIVNGGSDHMVKKDSYTSINPYNPFLSIWTAITRKTERGSVFVPEESISREQAIRMFTINNAYASFEETLKGSIEPGKFADFALLSHNILTCPIDTIKEIEVLMTMVDGKIVYDTGLIENE